MLGRWPGARATHRRWVWSLLAARSGGSPWAGVAGHVWDGWIAIDVDASVVESHFGLDRGQNGRPDGMRVTARLEPLHPKHRKNASDTESGVIGGSRLSLMTRPATTTRAKTLSAAIIPTSSS